MKKILSILIAMTLVMSLFGGIAFAAGSSSSGAMVIYRNPPKEEPAEEEPVEEATPVEAEEAVEETTPAEAEEVVEEATAEEAEEVVEETAPVEPEEATAEEATAEEPVEEEAVEEAEEVVEEATLEEATSEEATEEEAAPESVELPEDATKIHTLQDALNPDRSIDIWVSFEGDVLCAGTNVTLFAVLNGYENLTYAMHWEMNTGSGWTTVGELNRLTYSFVLNEQLYNAEWRVVVDITAGEIAEPAQEA